MDIPVNFNQPSPSLEIIIITINDFNNLSTQKIETIQQNLLKRDGLNLISCQVHALSTFFVKKKQMVPKRLLNACAVGSFILFHTIGHFTSATRITKSSHQMYLRIECEKIWPLENLHNID